MNTVDIEAVRQYGRNYRMSRGQNQFAQEFLINNSGRPQVHMTLIEEEYKAEQKEIELKKQMKLLARLPLKKWEPREDKTECYLCIDYFKEGDPYYELECEQKNNNHKYHQHCMTDLFKKGMGDKCIACKHEVDPVDIEAGDVVKTINQEVVVASQERGKNILMIICFHLEKYQIEHQVDLRELRAGNWKAATAQQLQDYQKIKEQSAKQEARIHFGVADQLGIQKKLGVLSKTLVKATKMFRTKRHKEVQEAKKSLIEELTLKYRIEFIAVEKFLELRHSEAKREPKRESKEADKEVVRKQRLAAIGERVLQAKKDGIADKLLLLAQQGSVSDSEDSDQPIQSVTSPIIDIHEKPISSNPKTKDQKACQDGPPAPLDNQPKQISDDLQKHQNVEQRSKINTSNGSPEKLIQTECQGQQMAAIIQPAQPIVEGSDPKQVEIPPTIKSSQFGVSSCNRDLNKKQNSLENDTKMQQNPSIIDPLPQQKQSDTDPVIHTTTNKIKPEINVTTTETKPVISEAHIEQTSDTKPLPRPKKRIRAPCKERRQRKATKEQSNVQTAPKGCGSRMSQQGGEQ